jgi:hypothetical protein
MWIALALVAALVGSAWTWRSFLADKLRAAAIPARASNTMLAATVPLPMTVVEGATEPAAPPPSWTVKHDGYVPIDGGILLTPESFHPNSAAYDLVIHFHGDVQIVKESIEYANVNAALAIINLGISSAPYREHYQSGGSFEHLLQQIETGLAARGMQAPTLRRLALTSWSAGYGAIESILESRVSPPPHHDPLDAIIALDGVHAGFVDRDPGRLADGTVRTFSNAARAALEGQIMLSVTHSEIDPVAYAGTKRSQLFILEQLGIASNAHPMLQLPASLSLPAAKNASPGGVNQPMVPTSDTRKGMLRVQGFKGDTKAHHAAHLTQMAAVVLPDLVARWSK